MRREVLGDAHVDRATAGATDLTRDFQEFITEYAWGGIWTRPGLDRRSRSVTPHRARRPRPPRGTRDAPARRAPQRADVEEIKEVLLQAAIYCGVPDANTAFKIAQRTLGDLGEA